MIEDHSSSPVPNPSGAGSSRSRAEMLHGDLGGLDWVRDDLRDRQAGQMARHWRRGRPSRRFWALLLTGLVGILLYLGWTQRSRPSAWEDPYGVDGSWFKVNIHTHVRVHDSPVVMELYKRMGYQCLAITEWARYRNDSLIQSTKKFNAPPAFSVMEASETGLAARGRHLLILGSASDYTGAGALSGSGTSENQRGDNHFPSSAQKSEKKKDSKAKSSKKTAPPPGKSQEDDAAESEDSFEDKSLSGEKVKGRMQQILEAAQKKGDFVVIAHPNYYDERWSHQEILGLQGFQAVEIYDALVEKVLERREKDEPDNEVLASESALATDLWDELLTQNRRVWGTVGDDFLDVRLRTPGDAWLLVLASQNTPDAILQALKNGSFYCSTGVQFVQLGTRGRSIRVEADRQCDIAFIGDGGKILSSEFGLSAALAMPREVTYVRVELKDSEGKRAWSQPFFPAKGAQKE